MIEAISGRFTDVPVRLFRAHDIRTRVVVLVTCDELLLGQEFIVASYRKQF